MRTAPTHQQKLSMKRAEEGKKALQEAIAAIDEMLTTLPTIITDLAAIDSIVPRQLTRMQADGFIRAAQRRIDVRKPIKEKFVNMVTACEQSLIRTGDAIFGLSSWSGAFEQREVLKRAAGRIRHCANAIDYNESEIIINEALAEAKDLIEQSIIFLEVEARRFLEKRLESPPPEALKTDTPPATPRSELFTAKVGAWGITVDLKEAGRRVKVWWQRKQASGS